jgi:hypothetical protein
MSREKQGKRSGSNGTEKVLVAVKASREISKTAFVWALTHIVHPGDCITLIVVVTSYNAGTFFFFGIQSWRLVCSVLFIVFLLFGLFVRPKAMDFP